MKHHLTLIFITLASCATLNAGWFTSRDDGTEIRIRIYEQSAEQAKRETGVWQIIAVVSVIGGVLVFFVGTALGSKTKKDSHE